MFEQNWCARYRYRCKTIISTRVNKKLEQQVKHNDTETHEAEWQWNMTWNWRGLICLFPCPPHHDADQRHVDICIMKFGLAHFTWIFVWVQSCSATSKSESCSASASAEKLFQYWNLRTGTSMHSLQLQRNTQTYTGKEFEAFQNGHVCLLKISYDGQGNFTAEPSGNTGQDFCVKDISFDLRSEILTRHMTNLFDNVWGGSGGSLNFDGSGIRKNIVSPPFGANLALWTFPKKISSLLRLRMQSSSAYQSCVLYIR